MPLKAGVITVSDKGSRGERVDESGPEITRILETMDIQVCRRTIIPDELTIIADTLREYADDNNLDLVVTTGGTGVSPRDVTPEATTSILDKEIPGLAETMRRESTAITPHGMLSRAVAGIRGRTLIINLPGSPKGVRENLTSILPALPHAVAKIKGDESDCASGIA